MRHLMSPMDFSVSELDDLMDLAYDIDRWGGEDNAVTREYTKEWVERQFGGMLPPAARP